MRIAKRHLSSTHWTGIRMPIESALLASVAWKSMGCHRPGHVKKLVFHLLSAKMQRMLPVLQCQSVFRRRCETLQLPDLSISI